MIANSTLRDFAYAETWAGLLIEQIFVSFASLIMPGFEELIAA
jgi:hypothetical protein